MIKLFVNNVETPFELTKFPDGTSQVWKIAQLPEPYGTDEILIQWMFENEGEVFQIVQLLRLLDKLGMPGATIFAPFMPYGRQDKALTNESCFALQVMKSVLYKAGAYEFVTYDGHSERAGTTSINPIDFHQSILNHDLICFPDEGALNRYYKNFPNIQKVFCEKVRDQATGEIKGLKVKNPQLLTQGQRILIVDDICDGGMTFIKVAEALRKVQRVNTIDLAVSHGIFSKGKQVLHDAGIRKIFTTNSRFGNEDGYKVC